MIKKFVSIILVLLFSINAVNAGILVSSTDGISLTGADGIKFVGTNGISLTGADGILSYQSNGISLTGADGISLTGADGISLTGADGATYTGASGISLTGADGITLTGADGISLTGADGITFTGADGVTYQADSVTVRQPSGISLTGADGISLTGADGIKSTGADGITLTGADGISLMGADGITFTGADSLVGFRYDGTSFTLYYPQGITFTGADGISLTGADGISLTGADGITFTGADDNYNTGKNLQSVDPELALLLDKSTDDSNINAVIVYHNYPTQNDLTKLQQLGIAGGTLYKKLPMISLTAKRSQIFELSKLANVRSIYGNRTLTFNSDPFFVKTGSYRVIPDRDLQRHNGGMPVTGKNITVAVLDTGVNSLHNDLANRVIQNVRLVDVQSASVGFSNPSPVEGIQNTDPLSGHGTFVSGVIAGSGQMSGTKYGGVAPGAKILGLSAGDLNLSYVLAGFDYILDKGANYNVRVVNCSFSSNTVFDYNDPVNIATQILTKNNVNVVFSAGNNGAGNGTLNPYAAAPWVVSVGATDEKGKLADYSSRGVFGNSLQRPTLSAPGTNIVSLRGGISQTGTLGVIGADTQRLAPAEIPFYTTASGTSFSAPQVAGAIALMLEANPNLTPAKIRDILSRTATPMPNYYRHEVGAGLLNTYAAVLESAFPSRRTGIFRAELERKTVKFTTGISQTFSGTAVPGAPVSTLINVPNQTIQYGVHISWGMSSNDLDLKVLDANNNLQGHSNYLNAPGLTGRREKVVLNYPSAQNLTALVSHTGNIGTSQEFVGAVETTKVDFAALKDIANLSETQKAAIYQSLRSFLMLSQGVRFRPNAAVTRAELAKTLVRGGFASQFVSASPMFSDVGDLTTRNAVESTQNRPEGKLFYDASSGGEFRPDVYATNLVAAVALVKSAELDNQAATAILPANVLDANFIPANLRGYVAVALQKGFLNLENNKFNPNNSINRIALASAIVKVAELN